MTDRKGDSKNIPIELRKLPQWVCRRDKLPINPRTGEGAKAGNPTTWGTFDEALRACRDKGYSGIGFEFAENGGIVGIDLDHVVDEDGVIKSWAQVIVDSLKSYTEYSPSGTGLHIFVRGDIPCDGRKAVLNKDTGEAIEMYKARRYFTVTGRKAFIYDFCENSDMLLQIYNSYFAEQKAEKPLSVPTSAYTVDSYLQRGLEKDAKLRALWNGQRDTTDESSCDIALMNKLAYWCNLDTDEMITAFLSSPYAALKDDKHAKKLQRDDYLQRTAKAAILSCDRTAVEDDAEYKERQSEKAKTTTKQPQAGEKRKRLTISDVRDTLNELGISVRFNSMSNLMEVEGMPAPYSKENAPNILPTWLSDYLMGAGYTRATEVRVASYIACVADEHRYNPVENYLISTKWDGVDRLPEVYRILGITEPKHQTYIRKWLIQCVALALNTFDKAIGAEGVLVLQGGQGCGKTSFFRMLSPFPKWFIEGAVLDVRDKDSQIHALSGWITELGELDSTLKREQASLKAFITQTSDLIRLPYARAATPSPRRTSFCGTVNPEDYLRDETGSRRFWTVPITNIDKQSLFALSREWVSQLWGQVYQKYCENPKSFRLTDEEMKQLQTDNFSFTIPLPYEEEIRKILDYSIPPNKWDWWSAADLADRIGGGATARSIGKAFKKVCDELPQCAPIVPPRTYRKIHGIRERLIPLYKKYPIRNQWSK
ncbi:MAG: hypothetical protein HFE30_07200 [Clostridiales bacterium]|nr:hypothetical protein [Clostridiales bacterium]